MQFNHGDLCMIDSIGMGSFYYNFRHSFIGKKVRFLHFDPETHRVIANGFFSCCVEAEEFIVCPTRYFLRGAKITLSSVKLEKIHE